MLEPLFKPQSVAVVGASRDREKVGNIILRNLISTFNGKIYPINNKVDKVEGLPSLKSLADVGVDLAVIAIPRDFVPQTVEDAVKGGTKSLIIITSGFKETDEKGAKLEEEIVHVAKKGGIRFLGPNTLGMITPTYNATFAYTDVVRGNMALVAQSGGVGVYMLNWAQRARLGVSYFVSLGNQSDISETDVFEYLANDIETKAIFSYLEGVKDGSSFLTNVPNVTRKKPIVFLKGGIGKRGAEAVKTHTGSVAGSIEIFKAAVRTVGGIFVETLEDMLNVAKLLSGEEPVSSDILVITNSGGHGVLTTDEIEREELNEVEIPDTVKSQLRGILPDQSTPRNPLDLSGDANKERYDKAISALQDLNCTKVVIVQSLPMVSCNDVARTLLNFKGKGVIGVVMGMDEDAAIKTLDTAKIPVFRFPEDAIRAVRFYSTRRNPSVKMRFSQPIEEAKKLISGKSELRDFEALKLMEIYGIKTPRWGMATSEEEAKKVADNIGYPIVMKISMDSPVHKTELGGVALNVEKEDVSNVYKRLSAISQRVIVQQQLSGVELFVGGIKDQAFGHAVVTGLGGIYVEVLRSLSYGLSPVYEEEAYEMMKESKVLDVLTARKRNYDVGSVLRTIVVISRMIVDLDIKELDINPLIVNEKGAFAIDVRVIL
ncbi:acetyl-CoA synthetase [Sulfolobales archaeon HS-7]|nr:acetyl-CoA synthetase [Sulfolobales archaeon HS-7]